MTPDVNVLVAASREDHPQHATARAWLETARDAAARGTSLTLLPMVAVGFLRIVTHAGIFSSRTPMPAAIAFLRGVLAGPGAELLGVGPEWPLMQHLCETHHLAGNDVADAWIAAAVVQNHEHLVTFDRGFRRLLGPNELTVLLP